MTNYPTSSAGSSLTSATVDYNTTLTGADLHRSRTFFSYDPAVARFGSTHKYPGYLLKKRRLERRQQALGSVLEVLMEPATQGEGLRAMADYLRQTLGSTFLISDGSFDQCAFTFTVYVDIAGSATGTHSLDYCEVKAEDPDGNVYYLTSASAWQASTQVYRSQSIDFGTNSGSPFSFVASFTTPVMPQTPMRLTLTLYCDKSATGSASDINWIEFSEIKATHLKPDEEDDVFRPEEVVTTNTTGNHGDNLEQEFLVGDTDAEKFYGPGVWEYLVSTGPDVWLPTQDWDGSGQSVHELRVANIKQQLESRQETYEFSHKWGDRVNLHNTLSYSASDDVAGVYVPVFVEQIYDRNASVYTRSSAVQQLQATQLVLSDFWFTADEGSPTSAPDNWMGRLPTPGDIGSVPWVTDTSPWDTYKIEENSGTTPMSHIRVDKTEGYVFYRRTNDQYLYRCDLDGGNVTSTTIKLEGLTLDRENQKVIVFNPSTSDIQEYNYDLTFSRTLYSKVGATANIGGLAVDQSGTYLIFCQQNVGGATTDNIDRLTLATLATTNIGNFTSLAIGEFGLIKACIDEDEGKAFLSLGGSVYSMAYPGGGTLTDIGVGGEALALDRVNQKVIYDLGAGGINWADYDGSNEETIYSFCAICRHYIY